jgi:hypothetical protein
MEVTFVLEDVASRQGDGASRDTASETSTAGRTVRVEDRPEAGGV